MLTFRGFLLRYCQELAGAKTSSLKKLFAIAEQGRPRVFEPLLLLSLCDHREEYLMKQAVGSSVSDAYRQMTARFHQSDLALEHFLETLPERSRYKRPLVAWRAESTRRQTDRQTLQRVATSLTKLLEQKGISRAEACRIAGLNKGNFYAFLKGDTSKLSRDTAMRTYRKLRSLPSPPPSPQADRAAPSPETSAFPAIAKVPGGSALAIMKAQRAPKPPHHARLSSRKTSSCQESEASS